MCIAIIIVFQAGLVNTSSLEKVPDYRGFSLEMFHFIVYTKQRKKCVQLMVQMCEGSLSPQGGGGVLCLPNSHPIQTTHTAVYKHTV